MSYDQDFNSELDDYITTSHRSKDSDDWTFDEATGVYVIHSKRLVMYNVKDNWICGDYDSIYNKERYIFDSQTQSWFDIVTQQYSFYDQTTQSYVPLTDEYWAGQPEGTRSIRFIVESSPHFETGRVAMADENGMTIGRDRSWDSRLRLPEMVVSKFHAMIFLDKQEHEFYIIDNGSQHGTFVNDVRLSESKQSSLPYALRHMDIIRIGSTRLVVHYHETGWPCPSCLTSDPIDIHSGKKEKEKANQHQFLDEVEQHRRDWIKNAKKLYFEDERPEKSGYLDRAEIRRKTTVPEKFVDPHLKQRQQEEEERKERYTPTASLNTPVQGIGNKMLQKLGWQEGQRLGKNENGILEPIAPRSQLSKSGIGSHHSSSVHIATNESKKDKHWRLAQERYQNAFSDQ